MKISFITALMAVTVAADNMPRFLEDKEEETPDHAKALGSCDSYTAEIVLEYSDCGGKGGNMDTCYSEWKQATSDDPNSWDRYKDLKADSEKPYFTNCKGDFDDPKPGCDGYKAWTEEGKYCKSCDSIKDCMDFVT